VLFDRLAERYQPLSDPVRRWFAEIVTEARHAGVSFLGHEQRSERRLHLYRGLLDLAENGCGDAETVRALVSLATGSEAPLYVSVPLGHVVGAMDHLQALGFAEACADFVAGRLASDYSIPPAMRLHRI
jgi:hypothetical protein